MNKLIIIISLFSSCLSFAEMAQLSDQDMGNTFGQAIFEVLEQNVDQSDGSELAMLRLTIGAQVEINANIGEISLGRYWRPEGTNCTGAGGQVCYNNDPPADYNDNIDWACTAAPCGSVGLTDKYESSFLTHSVGTQEFHNFPGGFQPDAGVDAKLRHLTLGQINCRSNCDASDPKQRVYEMTPFVQQNPYFEFAFDEDGDQRKLVGFRMGAEDSLGYQGNIIDVVSGFIRPTITAGIFGPDQTLTLETQLGGVRTVGWIDQSQTTILGCEGLVACFLDGIGISNSLEGLSSTAQLFPVQSNYLNHSTAFFFSLGTRSIDWSSVGGFAPETSRPGGWANLGGDGGLQASTQFGDHPINYFPGHPYANLFQTAVNGQQAQNYTSPQARWSN